VIIRPHSIVLDAEALSSLAAGQQRMQAWATVVRRTDSTLHASTVTLAEVTDGTARDAGVRRIAKAIRLEVVTPDIGYQAGRLRAGAAGTRRKIRDLTVDAVVAATALTLPTPVLVLTSDQGDLRRLLVGTHVKVEAIG
jgi:predicted nucleic acid-binding protein